MEDAIFLREKGKELLSSGERESFKEGVDLIVQAYRLGDSEATFLFARFLVDRYISLNDVRSSEEAGLSIMRSLANNGYTPARVFLNRYCESRYAKSVKTEFTEGKLKDFSGKEIKIDRKGVLTPVDAHLQYVNGMNILTLQLNLNFIAFVDIPEINDIIKASIEGIKMWQGEYTVFDGQGLQVRINVSLKKRFYDKVNVILMDDELNRSVLGMGKLLNNERIINTASEKRSFAKMGMGRWSTRSRKSICLYYNENGKVDRDLITHAMKHEFGHLLGLGDLYVEKECGRDGIKEGTYKELDGYIISDRIYNLVMCDHFGVISNNDIEMVVLAFSENKAQNYQQIKNKGRISKALGRGN